MLLSLALSVDTVPLLNLARHWLHLPQLDITALATGAGRQLREGSELGAAFHALNPDTVSVVCSVGSPGTWCLYRCRVFHRHSPFVVGFYTHRTTMPGQCKDYFAL